MKSKICVSIGNLEFEQIKLILPKYDLIEVRLDRLNLKNNQIEELFSSHSNLIATFRDIPWRMNEKKESLEIAIKSGAAYVDIDSLEDEIRIEKTMQFAKRNSTKVILSYHNYANTPNEEILSQIIFDMYEKGADIAKVACMIREEYEIKILISLYQKFKDLISIGMGNKGVITRINSLFLGAPFTYASLEKANPLGPGQLTYNEMLDILRIINK